MGFLKVKTGEVCGRWTILEAMPKLSWCKCECGTEKLVYNHHLKIKKGKTPGGCRSCSNRLSWAKKREECSSVPYLKFSRFKNIVNGAISRCINPEHPHWKDWGGRGISVSPEWVSSPMKFVRYLIDLPNSEDETLVLDRKDNEGNYEPGNLRFVSHAVSSLNRRKFSHKLVKGNDGRFVAKPKVS